MAIHIRDASSSRFGGAAVWPLTARAQQMERVRRIGLLMGFGENDAEGTLWLSSFTRALSELGWVDGRERERIFAKELISRLQPDAILAHGTPVTAAATGNTNDPECIWGCC